MGTEKIIHRKVVLLTHRIQLAELFQSETDLHKVATHNIHKNYEITQEGGIGKLLSGTITGWMS